MKKMVKFGSRKRFDEGGEVEEGERAKEYVAAKGDVAPSTFREAFAQARKEGKDRFIFNGKSYTTEMAGTKPAAFAAPKVGGRETAEENLAKRRPTDLASSKARHEGMKTAGERSQRESDAEKARESRLGSSILARDRLGSEPDAYIVNRRRRAAMEEAKESIPPSRTFGAGAMSAKGLGSMSGFSKGGKVGSASKRADGIAQRGKTRGKMY
ncbi:MAG: hypothetical protein EB120_10050 [Proteobacteria bacterium]|nr:hypothetical protein [Pseudomonadota bacterium]